jgi:hypothetical protein
LLVDANPTFFTKFGRRKKKKFPIFREKSGEQLAPHQWPLATPRLFVAKPFLS